MESKERDLLEGLYTKHRIIELTLNPVQGKFDAAHLKEINRIIFQDLPGAGIADVNPGEFRSPVPPGKDWIKQRALESVDVRTVVAYSAMDKKAQKELNEILKQVDSKQLGKLKTEEFIQAMAKFYSELDYIHPFQDGNSRTLRVFTKQLAQEAGYKLEWEQFNRSPAGRDFLYIARDKSVNEIAEPKIKDFGTKQEVVYSMDRLENNRDLPDLLRDAIQPMRAVAFQKLPEDEASKKHPELRVAYKTLRKAEEYFEVEIPNEKLRESAVAAVAKQIQAKLDKGETKYFANPRQQDRQQQHDEPEHER